MEFAGIKRDVFLANRGFASSHENYYNLSRKRSFPLQSSNFTYDPKDLAEINHDVLYREGENIQVRMLGCQQFSNAMLLTVDNAIGIYIRILRIVSNDFSICINIINEIAYI